MDNFLLGSQQSYDETSMGPDTKYLINGYFFTLFVSQPRHTFRFTYKDANVHSKSCAGPFVPSRFMGLLSYVVSCFLPTTPGKTNFFSKIKLLIVEAMLCSCHLSMAIQTPNVHICRSLSREDFREKHGCINASNFNCAGTRVKCDNLRIMPTGHPSKY